MDDGPVFEGVFTALITPFTADAAVIDFDRLEANVAAQAAVSVRGVVPCGTTGEAPTLKTHEHRLVVERTIAAARPLGLLTVAGAGSNDTAHAIELHRLAADAGADAALHVCPYYNRPSQEGLYRHFMAIADCCDLPIMLYNIPGRTGVSLAIDTIERLAAHENIQALKDATGSLALANQVILKTRLAVLSGDDPMTLPFMAIGAVGVVSVLSNLLPGRVRDLCDAVQRGDLRGARLIHQELLPLAEGLLGLDGNPVPLKMALCLLGRDSGAVRPPLAPLRESVVRDLEGLLADSGLFAREQTVPA